MPTRPPKRTLHGKIILVDELGYRWGPFNTGERRVVYKHLNTWIQQYGLDAFCTKTWTRDEFVFLTNTINKVNSAYGEGAALRSLTNVKRETRRLYEGRKSPLGKLWKRSKGVELTLRLGVVVEESEQFPEMAIAVATVVNGTYQIMNDDTTTTKTRKLDSKEIHGRFQTPDPSAANEQKRELVVKLSVDWARIYVRHGGGMSVLHENNVSGSPVTDSKDQGTVWEDDGSESMSFSEAEMP